MKLNFALDLADSIHEMADRLAYLERENAHLQKMLDMHQESAHAQDQHNRSMTASILTALIDPDSGINKTARIVERAKLAGITE